MLSGLAVAACLPPVALAAEPVEGLWSYRGSTVQVSSTAQGAYHGVVVAHVSATCPPVGTEVWSQLSGGGLSYTGTLNPYVFPCSPIAPVQATFQLSDADHGQVCATGLACEQIVQPAECQDFVDNDADGDIDLKDPGCEALVDTGEAPDPTLSLTSVSVPESAGLVNLPVTLSPTTSKPVSAKIVLLPGTATAPASPAWPAGADYAMSVGAVYLPAGAATGSFAVLIVEDYQPEPDETFTISLSDIVGARVGAAATVTIRDNDTGAPPTSLSQPVPRRTPTKREPATRGGGQSEENLPVCGVSPPTFPGKPTVGKDGRQRCPLARPRIARSARGGSPGVDRMKGGGGGDALVGLGGNDTLRGLGGGDRLGGGRGNDNLWGGSGGDELEGGDGDDRMYGGPGSDWLIEERYGDDRLYGGPGNDVIAGNHGHDRIDGGPGDDIISGGSGPDHVNCGPGYDTLYINLNSDRGRSRGCERIRHEADIEQRLCHSGGTDAGEQVRGGSGSDTCRARGGDDVLEGGGGSDRLYGDSGDDELFGRKGSDRMYGGAGNDDLEGGQGADKMYGGPGNDVLNGGYGRDRLSGGPGNDTLNAGWGERGEIVDCGPGHDTFIYGPGDKARNCEVKKRG